MKHVYVLYILIVLITSTFVIIIHRLNDKNKKLQYSITHDVDTLYIDSIGVAIKSKEIADLKIINRIKSDYIESLEKRLNLNSVHYLKLKSINDSLLNLVFVLSDTSDEGFSFKTKVDLFEVDGNIKYNPPAIRATLTQVDTLFQEIAIDVDRDGHHIAIMKSSSNLLKYTSATVVSMKHNKKWYENISVCAGVSINNFGYNFGGFYNNYGLSYLLGGESNYIIVNYKADIGSIFK